MRRSVVVHVALNFTRAFRRLPSQLQNLASKKDQRFRSSPFHPGLRTHKLKGELEGFWSYSINNSYRVLFRFISDQEVLYYDIGTHDIYR